MDSPRLRLPHGEKVFSIIKEHTRWISEGKADKKVEFGVPVCVVEDGTGFVLATRSCGRAATSTSRCRWLSAA